MLKRKHKNKEQTRDRKGITIIEVIIGVFLVGVILVTLYTIFTQAVGIMADAKQRIGAIALAMERTEYYRNFSYENIPVIDPVNVVSVERNGFTYEVETSVVMFDDPENGENTEGDYKQLRVKVLWINREKEKSIYFTNNFSPTGITHGAILINVYDGDSYSSLGGASVQLVEVIGGSTGTQLTDNDNGNALFFGLEGDNKEYQITISKSGYETLETYDASGASVPFDSIYKNVVLVSGDDSALRYFPLRQTSDLTVYVADEEEGDVSGVNVELVGGQKIGNDPSTYAYDDTGNPEETDSNGEIIYDDPKNSDLKMNPGNYEIANIDTLGKSGYEFVKIGDNRHPFILGFGTSDVLELIFVDELKNSLLVELKDSSDGSSVKDASVRVHSSTLGYDETVTSDPLGFAFFRFDDSDVFEELVVGDYDIEITADGYDTNSTTVSVNAFTSEVISLTLIE